MKSNCTRAFVALLVLAGTTVPLAVAAVSADAAVPRPAAPTHVRVTSASPSSFTVGASRAAHATRYVMFTSTVRADVYFTNLSKASSHRITVASATPSLAVTGRKYTQATYFYRVESLNGSRKTLSAIHEAHLAPPAPQNVQVVRPGTSGTGLALTWNLEKATSYQIVQATNSAMTAQRKVYRFNGNASAFTPYGLSHGTTYYFRVRATNGAQGSYSPVVSGTFNGHELHLTAMTWNVLHMQFDGKMDFGHRISPWRKRLPVVVSMIKGANPDVISINEASDWYNQPKHIRQIDTLHSALKSTYGLVGGDTMPNPRTGNYILYRKSLLRPDGPSGTSSAWEVSSSNWVVAQQFTARATGAQFLFVCAHLTHGGNSVNARRTSETSTMISRANSWVNSHGNGMPIIYSGDFNSFTGSHTSWLDGPEQLMRKDHVADSYVSAQSRVNTKYGSVNDYARRPSDTGRIIDHVTGTPGVAMRTWRQVMRLKNGAWPGTIPSDHNPVAAGLTVQY